MSYKSFIYNYLGIRLTLAHGLLAGQSLNRGKGSDRKTTALAAEAEVQRRLRTVSPEQRDPDMEVRMPSFVNPQKCDGCKALDKTACQHICPNDLMVLNKDTMKAFNREPEMCWECYNCVKICPVQAIDVRGYADFVPMGASVVPMRSTDSIMWTVKFRNGTLKRFKFPIRTTPEGEAEPAGGYDTDAPIDGPTLFTEPESLGLPKVWTTK